MEHPSTFPKKAGLVVLCSLVALSLRFFWLSEHAMAMTVENAGYWAMCLIALWCGWITFRWWRSENPRFRPGHGTWPAFAVVGVLVLVQQLHEPHMLKVNYDESVLLGIARMMHIEHLAAWPGGARLYDGSAVATVLIVDKRPLFFPFLVSLLHSITGYRIANVFFLNGLLGAVLLAIGTWIGRRYHARFGGLLFAALLGGLPLIAQNATGGGFDLLNVTLVALLGLITIAYLDRPTPDRLGLATAIGILLANTRYESIIFVCAPAAAFLLVWFEQRRLPALPWVVAFAPLGLIPPLFSNGVFASQDSFFQMPRGEFWSLGNYTNNLAHAAYYLFDFSRGGTNSLLLAIAGVISAALFGPVLLHDIRRRQLRPETKGLCIVGGLILLNTLLILGLGWGEWDDPPVSRFTLPFWFLLAWLVLEAARRTEHDIRRPFIRAAFIVSLVGAFLFGTADASYAGATHRFKASNALVSVMRFIKNYDPDRSVLIFAPSSIPFINEGYAALPADKGVVELGKYLATEKYGLYREILIVFEEERDLKTGDWIANLAQAPLLEHVRVTRLWRTMRTPFYRQTVFRVDGLKTGDTTSVPVWPHLDEKSTPEDRRKAAYELMP